MKNKKQIYQKTNIHFIGIGGVSQSALALHLLRLGQKVTGSDLSKNSYVKTLSSLGVKIYSRHKRSNVKGASEVVYTSAISKNNRELKGALKRGIKVVKRSELLGKIVSGYSKSIAVSGCHGKTTTTAMIANVLICAKLDPTVFLGGDYTFNNYRFGGGEYCVAEACEYDRNFLDIPAYIKVVLNIGDDHLDTYKNIGGVVEAFSQFVKGGIALLNADDMLTKSISKSASVTFGINERADYTAKRIKKGEKGYSFSVYIKGVCAGRINLSVLGYHNIYNALACVGVCDMLKVDFAKIKSGVEGFLGVKRRCEYLGEYCGLQTYADYAHHPKEISLTIKSMGSALYVFQPHTYSRTKNLMSQFKEVLEGVENLIIYKTYPAREKYDKKGDAKSLFNNLNGKNFYYANNFLSLREKINYLKDKVEKVVFLGAGDLYFLAKKLVEKNK